MTGEEKGLISTLIGTVEARFSGLESQINHRFDKIESKVEARFTEGEKRIDSLEKTRDQNYWPRQVVFAGILALVSAIVGASAAGWHL